MKVLSTIAAVAAVAVAGVACQPAAPAVAPNQPARVPQVWDAADPSIVASGSAVVLVGSSNNVHVPIRVVDPASASVTSTKAAWAQAPRDALPKLPAWVAAESSIVGPSIRRLPSGFGLFFAAKRAGATDAANPWCVGVATSSSVMGPYVGGAAPIYCGLSKEPGSNSWGRGAMSPAVFAGGSGRTFMVVALSRSVAPLGVVELTAAGTAVVGGVNARPSLPFASTTLGWLDQPSMVKDPSAGKFLLFFQSGAWNGSSAKVWAAVCDGPTGPCTRQAEPFLVGSSTRTGPTGFSIWSDAAGGLRVAYATWARGAEGAEAGRQVSFGRLETSGSVSLRP